ncbi:MAG: ribonuclease E/G [Pseudomonadota bacterium]
MSARMTPPAIAQIVFQNAPGSFRAVARDSKGRALRLFLRRWNGVGERARFGSVHQARIRAFADTLRGAFLELESGEEVFLRLSDRADLTEGARLSVQVQSEKRAGKLARVSIVGTLPSAYDAYQNWLDTLCQGSLLPQDEAPDQVEAAFELALQSSVTLPGGGRLHVDRTRALSAFDIDTAGRVGKGSAAARALHINRAAVQEMARQVCLRGLGGTLVLDCVAPLNANTRDRLHADARAAMSAYDLSGAQVLKPSAIGLLQVSLPWTVTPLADLLEEDPAETQLLALLRSLDRAAKSAPNSLLTLALSDPDWRAYSDHKAATDTALQSHLHGRVNVVRSGNERSETVLR